MKAATCILLAYSCTSEAYIYKYCTKDYKFVVDAEDQNAGYKKAAKLCYQAMTKGVYPGDEKGLDIIDICTNIKQCK